MLHAPQRTTVWLTLWDPWAWQRPSTEPHGIWKAAWVVDFWYSGILLPPFPLCCRCSDGEWFIISTYHLNRSYALIGSISILQAITYSWVSSIDSRPLFAFALPPWRLRYGNRTAGIVKHRCFPISSRSQEPNLLDSLWTQHQHRSGPTFWSQFWACQRRSICQWHLCSWDGFRNGGARWERLQEDSGIPQALYRLFHWKKIGATTRPLLKWSLKRSTRVYSFFWDGMGCGCLASSCHGPLKMWLMRHKVQHLYIRLFWYLLGTVQAGLYCSADRPDATDPVSTMKGWEMMGSES